MACASSSAVNEKLLNVCGAGSPRADRTMAATASTVPELPTATSNP